MKHLRARGRRGARRGGEWGGGGVGGARGGAGGVRAPGWSVLARGLRVARGAAAGVESPSQLVQSKVAGPTGAVAYLWYAKWALGPSVFAHFRPKGFAKMKKLHFAFVFTTKLVPR